jgi:hypothetical protein
VADRLLRLAQDCEHTARRVRAGDLDELASLVAVTLPTATSDLDAALDDLNALGGWCAAMTPPTAPCVVMTPPTAP